jgi:hypothetical protein
VYLQGARIGILEASTPSSMIRYVTCVYGTLYGVTVCTTDLAGGSLRRETEKFFESRFSEQLVRMAQGRKAATKSGSSEIRLSSYSR